MKESEHSRIEDVKRRLYDPKDQNVGQKHEGVLHPQNFKVATTWQDDISVDKTPQYMKKKSTSLFKKFFIAAIVFFIGAVGFALYMYMHGGVSVSNDNIEIKVLGNAFTKGGDELPLQVEIINHNNANLELANLLVEYPRGASDAASDIIRLPRDTIGVIKAGKSVTRNIKVTLFGDEQLIRNVKISLEYHPEGSNAIFTKEKVYPVTISSAPLILFVDAPDTATVDQTVSFNVTATLNTSLPEGAAMLQVSYPNGFVFDSAVPTPSVGNSVWSLASLTQTTPVSIAIKGKMLGQPGDQQVFHVYAGTTSPTDSSVVDVVYNSLLKTMTITKPFLEAQILVDGQDLPVYTASSDQKMHVTIHWVNNLSTRITNAQIALNISGNAYDKASIDPLEGFYDSLNNQVIWDKNTISEFESVEPGASGSVSFNIKSLSLLRSGGTIKDPQIALDVSIRGRQPGEGSTFGDVDNFAKKIIKITSDFQIASSPSYFAGPLPPKAESETKYSVTWTLSNSVNSIGNAVARSTIPVYVKWVGPTVSTNENISYNDVTREVVWNIGSVRPNTGFNSTREVSFVLSLTPSVSQVNSVPQLMKEVLLSGTDLFTNTLVKSTRGQITTALGGGSTGNDRVVK